VKLGQYFGEDKKTGLEIKRCDHLPDDTKVIIESYVGLGTSSTDEKYEERLKGKGVDVTEFKWCSSSPCVKDIDHLSNTLPASALPTKYWVSCGGGLKKTNKGDNTCKDGQHSRIVSTESGETQAVRCCADMVLDIDGKQPEEWHKNTNCNNWKYVGKLVAKCQNYNTTFLDAALICKEIGGRLCTKTEIEEGCARANNCDINAEYVWTSSTIKSTSSTSPTVSPSSITSTNPSDDESDVVTSLPGSLSGAHVKVKLRAGPPQKVSPHEKKIFVTILGAKITRHTATVLVVGDYDEGVPKKLPLPAMDPIMIIRDPPGGGSYAYYTNVRTTSSIIMRGHEAYVSQGASLSAGVVFDWGGEICGGLGVMKCEESNDIVSTHSMGIGGTKKTITAYKDGKTEISLVTTWSYQTSGDAGNAGHASDVFVVPTYYILIHDVIEISFDADACVGVSVQKVKFDVAPGENEKGISFLSRVGVDAMRDNLNETVKILNNMIHNETLTDEERGMAQSTIQDVEMAKKKWASIMDDYNSVNSFTDLTQLVNPSSWYEEVDNECNDLKWGESFVCSSYKDDFKDHWSSLFPAKLFPGTEANLADWKEVQSISFSGGGGELSFSLDESFYEEKGILDPEDIGGNVEQEQSLSFDRNVGFSIFGAGLDLELLQHADSGYMNHAFKHSLKQDDSSAGFVLVDPDVGDHFDVKVAIDKNYGSFVFKTTGGLSKCIHEAGTIPREQPGIELLSRPSGITLPDQSAIFKVRLINGGPTSNEYELSMDRRDNSDGLSVSVNGGVLAGNQHYEIFNPLESVNTTISISRGPSLYEYEPIRLYLESMCDGFSKTSTIAELEIYTDIKTDGVTKVIKFARECPKIEFMGELALGPKIVNAESSTDIKIILQNLERGTRGNLTAIAADDNESLEKVELRYRKVGKTLESDWNVARGDISGSMVDIDLVNSEEDDYGFLRQDWDIAEQPLADGNYELQARSFCPGDSIPSNLMYSTTNIALLKLDRIPPKPFLFPSETDTFHVGDALIFEYDEELDCTQPFSFTLDIAISGSGFVFNKDNMIVVCEDRMIGVQFDGTKFDLHDLTGNPTASHAEASTPSTTITLSNVKDKSFNSGERISVMVHFASNSAFASPDNTSSATASQTKYWATCGAGSNGLSNCGDGPLSQVASTENGETHEVRCCSDTDLNIDENMSGKWIQKSNCNNWSAANLKENGSIPICHSNRIWSDAVLICKENGGRLCTKTEVEEGCARGSGCKFDSEYIWTSELAPNHQRSRYRRLTEVSSIQIFQKPLVHGVMKNGINGQIEKSELTWLESKLTIMTSQLEQSIEERLGTQLMVLLMANVLCVLVLLSALLLYGFKIKS